MAESKNEGAAMSENDDSAEWMSWVGKTSTAMAFLDPEQANRMAVTLDRTPDFATGDELPPAWHWLYFHDIVERSRLGNDGHPALGVVMPPVPLERRMWAAGSMQFEGALRLGETATRVSRISSITPKQGRTGPLLFVSVEHEVSTPSSSTVRETQTIVYRELDADAGPKAPAAPDDATFQSEYTVDSTMLFRYSALTFNGHRIHYDSDYAREVEGYPGLVVHGPLLVTLLADLACAVWGPLASFKYRARSTLFAPGRFTVNGRASDSGSEVWVASDDGSLAMVATAMHRQEGRR